VPAGDGFEEDSEGRPPQTTEMWRGTRNLAIKCGYATEKTTHPAASAAYESIASRTGVMPFQNRRLPDWRALDFNQGMDQILALVEQRGACSWMR
jgi:hypothetical protein